MSSSLLAVCIWSSLTLAAQASNLLVNGGFENPGSVLPPPGSYNNYGPGTGIPGWLVGGESVDIHDNGHTRAHTGQYSLDLAGYYNPGSISQTLATVIGEQYSLDLWYAGHPYHPYGGPAMAQIFWEGASVSVLSIAPASGPLNMNWTHFQATVTATSAHSVLELVGLTQNGGVILDDVSVNGPSAPVPDSSTTALLMSLAGAALTWFRRVRVAGAC